MFRDTRRKKLRDRVIFAALGVCILTFGIWLNYKTVVDNDGSEEAAQKIKVESSKAVGTSEKSGSENATAAHGTDTPGMPESYLIKEVDGVVKVFLCNGDKKTLYLITSIPFELLSEGDQQMFVDGVYMETEDDLGEFLENFDS